MTYGEYKHAGRSLGNVLYHLSKLGIPLHIVESVVLQESTKLTYGNKPFANFVWNASDIPVFDFLGEFDTYNKLSKHKLSFKVGQKVMMAEEKKYFWGNDPTVSDLIMVVTDVKTDNTFGSGIGLKVSVPIQPNYSGDPLSVFYDSAYFSGISLEKEAEFASKLKDERKVVSIGFVREDGDFQVLATLNNNDDIVSQVSFESIIRQVVGAFDLVGVKVIVQERQDSPDYVHVN